MSQSRRPNSGGEINLSDAKAETVSKKRRPNSGEEINLSDAKAETVSKKRGRETDKPAENTTPPAAPVHHSRWSSAPDDERIEEFSRQISKDCRWQTIYQKLWPLLPKDFNWKEFLSEYDKTKRAVFDAFIRNTLKKSEDRYSFKKELPADHALQPFLTPFNNKHSDFKKLIQLFLVDFYNGLLTFEEVFCRGLFDASKKAERFSAFYYVNTDWITKEKQEDIELALTTRVKKAREDIVDELLRNEWPKKSETDAVHGHAVAYKVRARRSVVKSD